MSKIAVVWFLLSAVSAIAAGPDFSGTWKLNQARSEIRWMPAAPAPVMRIEHSGNRLRCSEEGGAILVLTIDGKASRTQSGQTVGSSILKWEGEALLINTLVHGPKGDYTQMDRWKLSRDGLTLRIAREIVRAAGGTESVLVYEKEGLRRELAERVEPAPKPTGGKYVVEAGTRLPLVLINSVSTKQSAEGDRVYLATGFPIVVDGKIVIPPGSYVAGTLTHVKRPGRVKGRGELFLRFDSLTLPNGVTRDFRARVGVLDGQAAGKLDRSEGKISSEGNKGGDAQTVGEAASTGASVGVIAGSVAGRAGMGLGIGAAAGAAAGMAGVLLSRGPDALLAKGSTLEMVLDRPLVFEEGELDFPPGQAPLVITPAQEGGQRRTPAPGRRFPM